MKNKEWIAEKHYLKSYPHFDGALTLAEAQALANDPSRVVRHTFYPFLIPTVTISDTLPIGVP